MFEQYTSDFKQVLPTTFDVSTLPSCIVKDHFLRRLEIVHPIKDITLKVFEVTVLVRTQ